MKNILIKTQILLALLFMVVVVSGCTQSGTVDKTNFDKAWEKAGEFDYNTAEKIPVGIFYQKERNITFIENASCSRRKVWISTINGNFRMFNNLFHDD